MHLQVFSQASCARLNLGERFGWLSFTEHTPPGSGRMLVGCLFLYFLSVEPLRVEINFSPSLLTPHLSPLGSEKEESSFLFRSVSFPSLWPVCPCPCLNVSSSLFLDSLLRNTELIKGLLSRSWCLLLFFCICRRNVLPSVCSC